MNYATIIRAFGFELQPDSAPASLSPFAPVFRLANSDGLWIVKRTQTPLSPAQAVAAWTRSLAVLGLGVVTPAPGFGENPRVFQHDDEEQVWAVYPFVQGSPYQGDTPHIRAAGDLLGKMPPVPTRISASRSVRRSSPLKPKRPKRIPPKSYISCSKLSHIRLKPHALISKCKLRDIFSRPARAWPPPAYR